VSPDPPPTGRLRRLAPALAALKPAWVGLGALACFGLGWLAYRLVSAEPEGSIAAATTALAPAGGAPDGSGRLPPPTAPPADARRLSPPPRRPALPRIAASQLAPAASACLTAGPPEILAAADPSNYGERQVRNWKGEPVPHRPSLIVLHETVVDEPTTLSLFQTPQGNDLRQASYHMLIGRDGRRLRVVADDRRAFGAGDSDFRGLAVQLRPAIPASVNNIALHVSLVSPADGADGERRHHSGYTRAQYASLARQLVQWQSLYGIASERIVTHQEVDRSGSRRDPRSFHWNLLASELRQRWRACGSGSGRIAATTAAAAPAAASPPPPDRAATGPGPGP